MASETEIIAALANECGLEWAQCDGESTSGRRCLRHRGHAGKCRCGVWWTASGRENRPTLEAWSAEWAGEHPGEPGPVREWTSEDGRVRWSLSSGEDFIILIAVGTMMAVRWSGERQWAMDAEDETTSADVAKLAELMASADGAGA